jgi:hypothetical protein
MIRKFLLSALFINGLAVAAMAQDRIIFRTGETLDVKISTINADAVIYTKSVNPNGPEFVMSKSEISKIVYQNGREETFGSQPAASAVSYQEKTIEPMNNNNQVKKMFHITPILVTENGVGLGLAYEKRIPKSKGMVSWSLPLAATWNLASDYYDNPKNDLMIYAYPGIKININKRNTPNTSYFVNPCFVIAAGQGIYDNNYLSSYSSTTRQLRFLLGAMVNGGINYHATDNFFLTGNFGLGISYVNMYDGVPKSVMPLVNLGFGVGFKL